MVGPLVLRGGCGSGIGHFGVSGRADSSRVGMLCTIKGFAWIMSMVASSGGLRSQLLASQKEPDKV